MMNIGALEAIIHVPDGGEWLTMYTTVLHLWRKPEFPLDAWISGLQIMSGSYGQK
jgi:hypothetical protein